MTGIDSAQRILRDVQVATNVAGLSPAPDGSVWGHRSEPGSGQKYLVRLDPTAGTVREVPLGSRRLDFSTTYESAFSLAVAADGAVWYDIDPVDTTENLLVRFDPPTGQSTRRSLPPEQGVATLEQLRFGPDGKLYFIRNLVNRSGSLPSLLGIGVFNPQTGSSRIIADAPVEEFTYVFRAAGKRREEVRREPIPLFDFAFGRDGAIWFPASRSCTGSIPPAAP